ncbi:MAG: Rrf2 family transcriptional regulator [Candidatus Omnitrophica bacterium]|nr:Rrf2 family transcriptional regulator [Candidatus Omnitrophota bacterium]
MKLSTRSTYGMRALVEIGLAGNRGPLSATAIASRQELSVAYLEQLLHRLKKRGLVSSIRGPKGGYVLAKEPEQISIGEIVQALDGTVSTLRIKDGQRHAQQIAQVVFRRVHERLAKSLNDVTLKDLCDDVRDGTAEPLDHHYVFHI